MHKPHPLSVCNGNTFEQFRYQNVFGQMLLNDSPKTLRAFNVITLILVSVPLDFLHAIKKHPVDLGIGLFAKIKFPIDSNTNPRNRRIFYRK